MAEYNPSKIIKDGNTYNFRDTTKIPLAGSNQISGSLIPATDNSIDIGSSTKNLKMLYTKGITIDGTQFLPSDYVPRSGGAVLTSYFLGRNVSTSNIMICGGAEATGNAHVQIFGSLGENPLTGAVKLCSVSGGSSVSIFFERANYFRPSADGAISLGIGNFRWGQIYSTNATISTSDARLKNSVKDIDNKLLDAWENIEPKQYKFNDATEKKGEKARLHTGYLAQDIQTECEKQGVNASDYGLFCHDSWEEQEEKKDENGQVIEPYRAKGDRYSLRYEEALVVECKYLRRCIARLTARIEELEKGNNTK